jgi:hypothetical protein
VDEDMKTSYPASVQSIERGLTLLEELSCEKDGLGISELARRTNLPASTVHRLLSVFVRRGYIARDNGSSSYRIDTKFLGLGFHPMAFFCQIYPLVCRHFVERMSRGEVKEVFLRMATRTFSVRSEHRGEKRGPFLVPELTGTTPKRCIPIRRDPSFDLCDHLDRKGDGAFVRFDENRVSWCTCVPIRRGENDTRSGRIGAGGAAKLSLSRIESISSSLVVLREEIEKTVFAAFEDHVERDP